MEKVNELLGQIVPIKRKINKRCLAYLKKELKKAKDNRLDFYDEDGEPYGNQYVSVTYDGGRHPEYASNAFSIVNGIYLTKNSKDKEVIMLDTEDDDEYGIKNISWDELVGIADYVYKILMPILKKG